jgi:menaquinone reductase, molybdopterin-binding-like subunit
MKVTRRDLLVWSAGAAAGLLVTPVPWKLLDDTSIWSQNWPWIPQPARGPIEVKQTSCSLCPKGCGMKVKMAAGWPVGVAGLSSHPISRGALCPLGFGAHQLNWHPQRLRTVRHGSSTSSWNDARKAFAKACGEGPIVVIDGYPGRAASSVLETFAQKRNGSYRVVLGSETRALAPYQTWSGVPPFSLGYDLENARTIVSFGAPLLDGWGTPGRFTRLWAERAAGVADPQLRLIQIEGTLSRTAARAWQWVPVPAGAEAALAAGLARVLLEEHLVAARGPMPTLTLAEAAAQTVLSPDAIRDLARAIGARTPAIAITSDNNPAVAALNVVLGSVGARGGIVRRSKRAQSYVSAVDAIPSARAVLIDSSVPWDFVPQTDAEVFRFAAWDGGSSRAEWLLPAPGFLEEATDIPGAQTSAIETYAVAPALTKATHEVQSAAQFIGSFDPSLTTAEKVIHVRCEDLFRGRKGTLRLQVATLVVQFASAQKIEEQLLKGAIWVGDAPDTASLKFGLKEWPAATPSPHPQSWSSTWPALVLPPLATKLYRESSLREAPELRKA